MFGGKHIQLKHFPFVPLDSGEAWLLGALVGAAGEGEERFVSPSVYRALRVTFPNFL